MMDMQASKGFTTNESNEHRRNWSQHRWDQAVQDGNYDLSRQHLNFEIVKGGMIQPIDKSKTIPQMMKARLDALGIRDPNEGLSEPKYRTAANIIFGGNRERMLELAFGNQDYDTLSRTKDHSHLKRMPEIEEWAKKQKRTYSHRAVTLKAISPYLCTRFTQQAINSSDTFCQRG